MFPHYDINSLILYVTIGIAGAYLINLSVNYNRVSYYSRKIGFICFLLIYVILAGLRLVTGHGIGGLDAFNYENEFLNALTTSSLFEDKDVLFGYFNKIIRYFTDSAIVYRFICYSIIAYSYILFIKKFCLKGISCIPFIVLILPYLKSFNTMRSSIAISFILIGLVLLKEKKILWSLIVIGASIFIHRMSVLYVLFLPFYAVFKNLKYTNSKSKLLIFIVSFTIIAYSLALYTQQYVISMGLLENTDLYYLSKNLNSSILEIAVTIIPLILISIMWLICNKRMHHNAETDFLKLMVSFDIIITPVAFILGMWRANEYFYVGRLAFWSYLIPCFSSKFDVTTRGFVNICFSILFSLWLFYRITREWEPCGFMPYILI